MIIERLTKYYMLELKVTK